MKDFQEDIEAVTQIELFPLYLKWCAALRGWGLRLLPELQKNAGLPLEYKTKLILKPGSELKIETTICNEIREHRGAVVIDHVANDENYCSHPTPALYGFQSYISMPIFRNNGEFFGTLCAIDSKPAKLANTATVDMFKLFAD